MAKKYNVSPWIGPDEHGRWQRVLTDYHKPGEGQDAKWWAVVVDPRPAEGTGPGWAIFFWTDETGYFDSIVEGQPGQTIEDLKRIADEKLAACPNLIVETAKTELREWQKVSNYTERTVKGMRGGGINNEFYLVRVYDNGHTIWDVKGVAPGLQTALYEDVNLLENTRSRNPGAYSQSIMMEKVDKILSQLSNVTVTAPHKATKKPAAKQQAAPANTTTVEQTSTQEPTMSNAETQSTLEMMKDALKQGVGMQGSKKLRDLVIKFAHSIAKMILGDAYPEFANSKVGIRILEVLSPPILHYLANSNPDFPLFFGQADTIAKACKLCTTADVYEISGEAMEELMANAQALAQMAGTVIKGQQMLGGDVSALDALQTLARSKATAPA